MTIPDNWTPTAANINALPEPLREYIMRLSTDENRAGLIAKVQILEEQVKALNRMLEEAPIVKVRGKVGELAIIVVSHSLVGKRVRLVEVDDGRS
jgi:hypothetical protein